jgi:hypothetical protein
MNTSNSKMAVWLVGAAIFGGLTAWPEAAFAAEKSDKGAEKLTLEELRAQRKEMVQRRRRIIFNNDGDDISGYTDDHVTPRTKETEVRASTPEGLLSMRTAALVGSQVDSIFYHSALGLKLHHGGGSYEEIYGAPDLTGAYTRNRVKLLKNYDKDALDVMVDFCRENDLEIFYSNRMNDMHDFYIPGILYYLKVRHPEYTIGHSYSGKTPQESLKDLLQTRKLMSGYNFALPVIRELTVEAMREVCRTYDVDGIELDYFRSPLLFPMPVQPRELEMLNDMMREMRKMTEEEGLKRGRPFLIAARYMIDHERSLYHGLDVKTWLEEGLVDILTGAWEGSQRQPTTSLFELASKHGVPCYPIVHCRQKDGVNKTGKYDWKVWRADALRCFAQGASGITTFNMFEPTLPMWGELGEPEALRTMDKTYVWDYLPSAGYSRDAPPVTVTKDGCEPIPLWIGDDLQSAPPAGKTRSIKLRIHRTWDTTKAGGSDTDGYRSLVLKLNGHRLRPSVAMFEGGADGGSTQAYPFSQKWRFKTDPDDAGVAGSWFAQHLDDADWTSMRSDVDKGWESQGFAGYTGIGWYRTHLPTTPAQPPRFAYIHFAAIDEQAWVYLNGEPIAEHTTETTGLSVSQIWTKPFSVNVSDLLRADGPNLLTVRVHNSEAMGGIWKPVRLIMSDATMDEKALNEAVKELTPGPKSGWLEFKPDPQLFKLGENHIVAAEKNLSSETVTIDDVRLEVSFVRQHGGEE